MNPLSKEISSLAGLSDGQSAYINKINLNGILRRRIFDLGLVPGTRVECVRRSPAGNPIAYFVRGTTIALRNEDAARIHINLSAEEHHDRSI